MYYLFIFVGIMVSLATNLISVYYLSVHQDRKGARIAIKDYLFTKKKITYFSLGIIASALAGFLQAVYGNYLLAIITQIFLLNALAFLAWLDKKENIVPNKYLLYMLLSALVLLIAKIIQAVILNMGVLAVLVTPVIGAAVTFIPMYLGHLISRGGIGAGDVKLFTVIGVLLGFRSSYILLMSAFIIAAFYSLFELIRKKITLKTNLPFVPFIAVAMFFVIFLGI